MSKKIALVAVMTLVLVLAAASWVFAAQNVQFNGSNNGFNDFAATPKVFNPDGNTNYPNEIYLPNEQTPADYPIHSNYTATTDACASCHATHTAVGENLLQWGSVYDTCMACHDGTVSTTYNVIDGTVGNTNAPTSAGLFGHGNEASLSNHNVSGAMSVYAAPGGPGTAKAPLTSPWDEEFSCASCHTPHGMGGNARLLNPDVNGEATAAYASGKTKGVELQYAGKNDAGENQYYTDFDNDKVKDTWLYSGHGYSDKVAIFADAQKLASSAYTISNATGYTLVTIPNAEGKLTANFIGAVKVTMNVSDKLTANEKVQHVSGLNTFCSACHVDYNTSSVDAPTSNLNGTYTEAYRHKVGRDSSSHLADLTKVNMKLEATPDGKNNITCETCHVAHGTDSAYWESTLENANDGSLPSGITTADLKEVAGSSALKRLPNMGTCESCHKKGEASQGYGANNGGSVVPTSNETSHAPGGGYVGQDACTNCHTDIYKHYQETWHPEQSRPGLTQNVATHAINIQGQDSIDAIVPGFYQAIVDTQNEIAKVGFDDKGRLDLDPADWVNKGVVANKVKVWSTGTATGQEIMVRGNVVGKTGDLADRWYIVAALDEELNITPVLEADGSQAPPEDYTCGTRGCHTTGYVAGTNGNQGVSSDFTRWLNAAAAGNKVPFELGVTCEACHGQGGNHVKAPSASNIVNPSDYSLRVQTVGTQADGKGNFTTFDATKGFLDYIGTTGNAKSCAQCHNGHHQPEFYAQPNAAGSIVAWPTDPDKNIHFTGVVTPDNPKGSTIATCVTCHSPHEESADPGQLAKPTIAQTCQQCHKNKGTKNADGTINGLTFTEPGRIDHSFPGN